MNLSMVRLGMGIVITAAALTGCATASRDWKQAAQTDTLSAYKTFLSRHSDAEQANEARKRIADINCEQAWQAALKADTSGRYKEFITKYPGSRFESEANAHLAANEAWERTAPQNTIAAYEDFLLKHPLYRKRDDVNQLVTRMKAERDSQAAHKAKVLDFGKKWKSVVESGTLEEFLRLRSSDAGTAYVSGWNDCEESPSTNARSKQYYMCNSKLFSVYALKKAEPWIVCVDYRAPTYSVVPGGYVNAGVCPIFTFPDGGGAMETDVRFTSVTPKWDHTEAYPLLNSGAANCLAGWSKGSWTIASGNTVQGRIGWTVKRWWIRVPTTHAEGSTNVSLHVAATGPFGETKAETNDINEEFTLTVVAARDPTREQVFALWASALEVGESLQIYTKDEEKRDLYRPALAWLDDVLGRLEKSSNGDIQELVKSMRGHTFYRNVLNSLK